MERLVLNRIHHLNDGYLPWTSGLLTIEYLFGLPGAKHWWERVTDSFMQKICKHWLLQTSKDRVEADRIFTYMNSINESIKFEIEHPKNWKLSLLDFTESIKDDTSAFTFYKTLEKISIWPHFKSAFPTSAKTSFIRNELQRIIERCTDPYAKKFAIQGFKRMLKTNEYPENLI